MFIITNIVDFYYNELMMELKYNFLSSKVYLCNSSHCLYMFYRFVGSDARDGYGNKKILWVKEML